MCSSSSQLHIFLPNFVDDMLEVCHSGVGGVFSGIVTQVTTRDYNVFHMTAK
jgi:hypothetical protein